jgi:hypothetical protein
MYSSSRAKCSTLTLGVDGLSWKTTRRFRCMLLNRALAANADALKDVDMTDLGGGMFLAPAWNTIGGETP